MTFLTDLVLVASHLKQKRNPKSPHKIFPKTLGRSKWNLMCRELITPREILSQVRKCASWHTSSWGLLNLFVTEPVHTHRINNFTFVKPHVYRLQWPQIPIQIRCWDVLKLTLSWTGKHSGNSHYAPYCTWKALLWTWSSGHQSWKPLCAVLRRFHRETLCGLSLCPCLTLPIPSLSALPCLP